MNEQPSSADPTPELTLEIAHLLLIDVVDYSTLLVNEEIELLQELNQIVRSTAQFRQAEQAGTLTRLPTGDGMALLFSHSPEEPVRCALEITQALKGCPHIRLRMGAHSGPVNRVEDVNDTLNIAGPGINIAQRVMDCGDAGHILVSEHLADDLRQYRHWKPYLHDLGECVVKHGVQLRVYNLCKKELGNPQVPAKFSYGHRWREGGPPPWLRHLGGRKWMLAAGAALILALIPFFLLRHRSILASRVNRSQARATTATAPVPQKSIAVLPFDNLSHERENAYFTEGIQEEILSRLARIADLRVISRTSTRQYQSKPGNLREIAKQLGVANILEGSVQKSGDQVRVNVQLISAATDSPLWGETYDRKLTDIFAVESEVAKGIAASLQARLTGREEQALAARPTGNAEAYEAYLRGAAFYTHSTYSDEPIEQAIGFFDKAVQLDPNFATAWARLSRANAFFYFRHGDTGTGRRAAAKRALDTAQRLEPNSPESLLALGYYQYWVLRDFELAKATFQVVSKMLPGSSEVSFALGAISRRQGHWQESIASLEQALVVDPRNTDLLIHTADTYAMLRQFPAALKLYDRALDILPEDPDLLITKAGIYQALGNLEEAAKWLPRLHTQSSAPAINSKIIIQLLLEHRQAEAVPLLRAREARFHFGSAFYESANGVNLALIQRLTGDSAGARISAQKAREKLDSLCDGEPENAIFAANLSQAYALSGQKDAALREADRAIALLPRAKDAVDGPEMEENLALVEMLVSENSRAISTLSLLLRTPYDGWYYLTPVTPALLRLDPTWDSLRDDPLFQKLCEDSPR